MEATTVKVMDRSGEIIRLNCGYIACHEEKTVIYVTPHSMTLNSTTLTLEDAVTAAQRFADLLSDCFPATDEE